MYCAHCGAKIRERVQFCPICGMKIGEDSSSGKQKNLIVYVICGIIIAVVIGLFVMKAFNDTNTEVQEVRQSSSEMTENDNELQQVSEEEETLIGKADEFDIIGIWTVEGEKKQIDPLAEPNFDENPTVQIEVISVSDDENEITILYTGTEPYQNVFYPGETYKGQLMGIENNESSICKTYSVCGIRMEFMQLYYYGDTSDLRECCTIGEKNDYDIRLWK